MAEKDSPANKPIETDLWRQGYERGLYEAHMSDLSTCDYFQRQYGGDPDGICSFGCWEEPECVTCEPSEGWPIANLQEQAIRSGKSSL